MKKFLISLLVAFIASAVIAANYSSDTLSSVDQSYDGRVIAKYFSYSANGTAVTNSTISLAYIPANAMIIRGEISISALGGTNMYQLGLAGADGSGYYTGTTANDVDLFTTSTTASNAVVDTFATLENSDLNAQFELGERPVYLTITAPAGTSVWPTNAVVKGCVLYIEP